MSNNTVIIKAIYTGRVAFKGIALTDGRVAIKEVVKGFIERGWIDWEATKSEGIIDWMSISLTYDSDGVEKFKKVYSIRFEEDWHARFEFEAASYSLADISELIVNVVLDEIGEEEPNFSMYLDSDKTNNISYSCVDGIYSLELRKDGYFDGHTYKVCYNNKSEAEAVIDGLSKGYELLCNADGYDSFSTAIYHLLTTFLQVKNHVIPCELSIDKDNEDATIKVGDTFRILFHRCGLEVYAYDVCIAEKYFPYFEVGFGFSMNMSIDFLYNLLMIFRLKFDERHKQDNILIADSIINYRGTMGVHSYGEISLYYEDMELVLSIGGLNKGYFTFNGKSYDNFKELKIISYGISNLLEV